MKKIVLILTGLMLMVSIAALASDGGSQMKGSAEGVFGFDGTHKPVWHLKAGNPQLIGGYGDNFSYNGAKVKAVRGDAEVLLDTERDMGIMTASFRGTINPERNKVYTGQIELVYKVLPKKGMPFMEGGVADFVYLHGNTRQGPPVMPKTKTYLGAWSQVDIYVDEKLIYKDLDGHMMYTERVRDTKTQAIYADEARKAFYSPMKPEKGYITDPYGRELHFVVHSRIKDPGNFPPHSVWLHLNYEEAEEIK